MREAFWSVAVFSLDLQVAGVCSVTRGPGGDSWVRHA